MEYIPPSLIKDIERTPRAYNHKMRDHKVYKPVLLLSVEVFQVVLHKFMLYRSTLYCML